MFGTKHGLGTVEIALSAAVLGLAAASIVPVFNRVDEGTRKSRIVSTMIALESSMTAALQDVDNFRRSPGLQAAVKAAVDAGGPMPAIVLESFQGPVAQHPSIGNPKLFSGQGDPGCAGSDCEVGVELDLRVFTDPVTGRRSVLGAYRIAPTPEYAQRYKISPLGGSFRDPEDYRLVIPSRFYEDPNASTCPPGGIMRGINRVTGEVLCWDPPSASDRCPAGWILKNFYADSTDGRLKPRCVKLRRATCTNSAHHHVLNRINPHYLDPESIPPGQPQPSMPAAGRCVPIMADTVPVYPGGYRCPLGHAFYHMRSPSGPCDLNPGVIRQQAPVYEDY
jgi:hypothetical protein